MRRVRFLIIGSLFLGSATALTAASPAAIEMRETAGPLEQQAKPLVGNQVPKRKSADAAAYPWELRRMGAKAALIVQVTVDKSGRVVELRRAQGPLLQPAIGSPSDEKAEQAAADAVIRSVTAALSDWRFADPPSGPSTFQLSFTFVGGRAGYTLTDPSEVLPTQAAATPWAAANGALQTGNGLKLPKKNKYVKPVYPQAALDARVQGEVVLEVVIDTDGTVADVRILKSVPLLDQAAIEATLQARYEPLQVNGIPVRVLSVVTHNFSFKTKTE
jgi:protein TonB